MSIMRRYEIIFGALRLPVDFLMILGAFWAAYYLRPITDLIPGVQYQFRPELLPSPGDYLYLTLFSDVALVLLFAFDRLYSLKNTHLFSREFPRILFWVSAWIMFIIAYYFLIVHQLFFSRIALAHIWFFTILFVMLGRLFILLIQRYLLLFGIGKRRVLFLGAGSLALHLYETLKVDSRYNILGAIAIQPHSTAVIPILGSFQEIERIVKQYHPEEMIQATPDIDNDQSGEVLSLCRYYQINYHFVPDLVKLQRTNVEVEMLGDIPLVSLKESALDGWGYVYKRLFDIVFSLMAMVLLAPLFLVIALAIKLDSPGPIVYKSKRSYRDLIFNVYKFRSMVVHAERLKKDLLDQNERSGPLFKLKNDPRITRVGRFLRKTSLDELPQLINVLMGNMSVVGPRPHLPEEVAQYARHHRRVFAIKPGLTGIAQVNGRSNLDFEQEVQLDVYYIENWSPWIDLKIILKSVLVVFKGDGV